MQASISTPHAQPASALPHFDNAAAWYGPDMADRQDWRVQLDDAAVRELDAAVDAALARGLDMARLRVEDFALPSLAPSLQALRREMLHGRGFFLLRGWPSHERSLAQNAMAFMAIGTHLGEAVPQNAKGHVLGHVTNQGADFSDPTTRGYQTGEGLSFHTDAGDVVGLLCVRPSRSGGVSRIASSTTVWNEMVRRRPDLALELQQPLAHSRAGEIGEGQKSTFMLPVFQFCGDHLVTVLVPSYIRGAQKFEGAVKLTEAQRAALKMVGQIAEDPGVYLDMDFRPGDMQFLCNHTMLHSRTAYEDWPEPGRRRHLLRLWLSCADGPSLPDNMTTEFQGRTASGRPNGVRVPGVPLIAPLDIN